VPRRLGSLISVTLVLLLGGAPACGLRHHSVKGRTGTLSVTPPSGKAGATFALMAGGFKPGEAMTFEIDGPHKIRFVGPSHTADPQGTVSSNYVPQSGDPAGVYTVLAVGNEGTRAQGSITITG
jgi:hypothetical protein